MHIWVEFFQHFLFWQAEGERTQIDADNGPQEASTKKKKKKKAKGEAIDSEPMVEDKPSEVADGDGYAEPETEKKKKKEKRKLAQEQAPEISNGVNGFDSYQQETAKKKKKKGQEVGGDDLQTASEVKKKKKKKMKIDDSEWTVLPWKCMAIILYCYNLVLP